ncbi:MAG: peptidylprolyl isomerase [Saprospiraceae bacterium]|nr:peptidylprolyl isomerase [Saprospiraceae bacterium]
MMFKYLLSTALAVFFLHTAHAQNDPALFTVKGNPVSVSEFKYIYAKSNQDKADFTEKSLRDYLELYINFKLKVQKARDMKLDTISSLNAELDGYKRQLSKSYLEDKEVTDKLVKDTYERMQQDVDISHIVIICDRTKSPKDTLAAYNRAAHLLKMIQKGADFNKIAADSSEDKTAKENRGNLGFITAMLPDGYHAIEKAIYSAKPGALIGPIRSSSGYHLIRVNGFRAARGEMEVSHILIRKGENEEKHAKARMKADSAYQALVAGGKWEDVCAKFTEDKATASKSGYIGFFGINRYQKGFEDAAFGLANNGDFSKPVETSLGFHVIKRNSHRGIAKFEEIKRGLTDRVKRDSRSEAARQTMIARIRKDVGYQEFPETFKKWSAKQTDTVFLTFKWKPDAAKPQDLLVRYGKEKSYTVADFEDFCARSSRDRMRGVGIPIGETIQKLYTQWNEETTMQFEESQLDKKYPEFKSLMREYEEGILLFEALKQNVWDRANSDSVGLEDYYRINLSQKYKWDERARVSIYSLKTDDTKIIDNVRAFAASNPSAAVVKKFNTPDNELVTVIEKSYERNKNKELGQLWKTGDMTDSKIDPGTKTSSFQKIEEIMPPTGKTLAEARGYAVADYQDYLEKKWIEDLRKEYPVKVSEEVLKGLIKK